jgi:hypothetical protein
MNLRSTIARLVIGSAALLFAACSIISGSDVPLRAGMTPDDTIGAMGPPDLKDNIADPSHRGGTVQRFVWLDSQTQGVFGTDNKLASIQRVDIGGGQVAAGSAQNGPPQRFDPVATPMNYLFFPVKAGFTYLGAGLNCAAGGTCQKPVLPSPAG